MAMNAYIVECVRTAGGKRNGSLSQWHPADLGAVVVDELMRRTKVPAADIDDVVWGCVSQVGAQGANLGRNVVLSSSVLPESVPGTTVDRQCGSSVQAFQVASQAVMSGTMDMVIAGGSEVMSLVPIGSSVMDGLANNHGNPWGGEFIQKRYGEGVQFSQFEGAELVAKKYGVTRAEMDALAARSHQLAAQATKNGWFAKEIVPITHNIKGVEGTGSFDKDEGIRPNTNVEALAKLKTLAADGVVTAGSSSQITDGASAILIVNERALKKYNLKPRAVVRALAVAGADPKIMLDAPVPGVKLALKAAGLRADQIDALEVNEAFASVPLAVIKSHGIPLEKLNQWGGAMALGHALGSTGTRCMTTLCSILEHKSLRYGMFTICEGGGTSNTVIIERVSAPVPLVAAKL